MVDINASSLILLKFVSSISNVNTTDIFQNNSVEEDDQELSPPDNTVDLKHARFIVQKCLVPLVTLGGVTGNVVSIAVLSHKTMKTSTNCYLTALAIFDILYLLTSMVLSLKHYENVNKEMIFQYVYMISRVLADICANTSVCLTMTFTIERYIAVCHPMKGRVICTPQRARIIALLVVFFVICCTTPEFWEREVYTRMSKSGNVSQVTYRIRRTELGISKSFSVYYLWFLTIIFTFVPLTALLFFNLVLIRSVCTANRLRREMTYVAVNRMNEKHPGEQTRITCMLIGVALAFIVCQIPTASMIIYYTYIDIKAIDLSMYEWNNLRIAGNVTNLLLSINAAINFILYSVMSSKFRRVFLRMFCKSKSGHKLRRTFSEYSNVSTGTSVLRRQSTLKGMRMDKDKPNSSPYNMMTKFQLVPSSLNAQSISSKTHSCKSSDSEDGLQNGYMDTVL